MCVRAVCVRVCVWLEVKSLTDTFVSSDPPGVSDTGRVRGVIR